MTTPLKGRGGPLGAAALAMTLAVTLAPVDAVAQQRAEDTIVGANGKVYPRSPAVVRGRHGDLFDGYTFDVICTDGGAGFKADLKRLAKLVRLIDASGRRVVWTVPPPKALVNTQNVIRGALPHQACTRRGLTQQELIFDRYSDPTFLNFRSTLSKVKRQTFWRTDPHWTTAGASVFTKQLAKRLDPALGKRQRYKAGPPQTAVGAMTTAEGGDTSETVASRVPKGKVKVRPLPGTDDVGGATKISDHEWVAKPANLTYPGRTLIIGDSFGYIALTNLRPLFRRGRFLWADNRPAKMARAIAQADTVVIEVAHLFLGATPLATKSFRKVVRKKLN